MFYQNWNSPLDAARVQHKVADIQRDSDEDLNVAITSYREAVPLYQQAESWSQAAELQKTIGDLETKLGKLGLAALSYKAAAETYEIRLHRQLDAARLHKQIGDIRVDIEKPDLALPSYRKARDLCSVVRQTEKDTNRELLLGSWLTVLRW